MTSIPFWLTSVCAILLQIHLSLGQTDIIFYNQMNDKLQFDYVSSAVQFVIEGNCPGAGTCAKIKVSDSDSWLQTKLDDINTIGYIDIVLQIDFLFTGFGTGIFKIYQKNDISTSTLDHLIQSYDQNDITQNKQYQRSFNLHVDAENNDKLGIYFLAQSSVSQSAYIYIDNIYIFGTKTTAPTSAPSLSPTNPTFSPTQNPIPIATTNPTINPTFYPTTNPTKIPTFLPTKIPTISPTIQPTETPTFLPTKIPTLFPTKMPTFLPTKILSLSPTKYPIISPSLEATMKATDLEFGVRFSISFEYDALVNFSNITDGLLTNILVNVTEDLLDTNTETVDDKECIKSTDYDINIDEIEKIISINATIYVCNKETETILSVHVHDNLERDLLKLTTNNQILYVGKQNISIQVGIIQRNEQFLSTVIIPTETINMMDINASSETDVFMIIMIILGSIIFICILLIIFIFICKAQKDGRKHIELKLSNSGITMPSYKIGEPPNKSNKKKQIKYENGYQLTPTDDMDNNNEPFGVFGDDEDNTTEIVCDEDRDKTMDESPGEIIDDNTLKGDEQSPGKLIYDEYKGKTRGQWTDDNTLKGDEILYDEQGLKQWLMNDSELQQYYTIFIQNGYESLDFVKEITNRKQLIDIGINNEQHLIKLMDKINSLRGRNGENDEIIINGNDETPN